MQNKLSEIMKWLCRYKDSTQCRGVVIGISGGKDSTTVAMLAKKVWGDKVFGVKNLKVFCKDRQLLPVIVAISVGVIKTHKTKECA